LLGHHNSSDTSRTIRTNVVQIVNHPKYDQGTHNNYDLSLVKLETKIDFTRTPNVRPVCLPKDDHNDFVGYKATVSGWGTKEAGGAKSNVLLEVDVDVIDSDSCWQDFGYREAEITEQMLCAHVEGGGKDSCQGDSGTFHFNF
jgi:secreted trypsin-like serine protease